MSNPKYSAEFIIDFFCHSHKAKCIGVCAINGTFCPAISSEKCFTVQKPHVFVALLFGVGISGIDYFFSCLCILFILVGVRSAHH